MTTVFENVNESVDSEAEAHQTAKPVFRTTIEMKKDLKDWLVTVFDTEGTSVEDITGYVDLFWTLGIRTKDNLVNEIHRASNCVSIARHQRQLKAACQHEEIMLTTQEKNTMNESSKNVEGSSESNQRQSGTVYVKRTWPNGDVYEGMMKHGNKHGSGKMTYANGNVYEGDYQDNLHQGYGKMSYSNGIVYEGEWHAGDEHGYGKRVAKTGEIFVGKFQCGVIRGYGTLTKRSGDKFEGVYMPGCFPDMSGTLTYKGVKRSVNYFHGIELIVHITVLYNIVVLVAPFVIIIAVISSRYSPGACHLVN